MSYTKGQLVGAALEEIGIAEYEFDISPEQRQSAIRRLDSMMAEWNGRNILLSFPIAKEENSSPDDDSNIPNWSWEAVITNLAIRLAPSYGKQVSQETRATAKHAYTTICGRSAVPKEMNFPLMPKGAGYKETEFRYIPEGRSKYLKNLDDRVDPSRGVE